MQNYIWTIENTVVNISLQDKVYIHITSEDRDYYNDLKEAFSFHVPGYRYMPAFRRGKWDGKLSLFDFSDKTLPYGLFLDFLKFHKKKFKNELLNVDSDVKNLFDGVTLKPKFNLKLYPYDYQEDCIITALKYKRCILHVSTASGKSVIISYIIKTLLEKYKKNQYLIIVPTTNLVEQFYGDMKDYGIKEDIIGRVYSDIKEPDKSIVISTWQSLARNHDWLTRFHGVIVDECHTAGGSLQIRNILEKATNADYRMGVTGTLPTAHIDILNIKAFLGPILRKYSASMLGDAGYVSQCHIKVYKLSYNRQFEGEYFDVRREVVCNPPRMRFIADLIKGIDDNILILVNLVENEGMILESYLTEHLPDKDVVFLWGDTKVKEREKHRAGFEDDKNKVVIATYPIFKMGVNVPSLKYIMFASPLKSKISVLQSVGRVLRKYIDKENGEVIDLVDIVPYLETHGELRQEYYKKENFDINIINSHLDNMII
jgi:superfamily II DNA or RNA helicase